jgi:nucleotide-binding universal stress UspA family protein
MLKRIMVALDGSRLAEQTLPFASALARAFDAEIILLRVVEMPTVAPSRAIDSFDWRVQRTAAIAYLRKVKRRLREEGIEVDLDVTDGRACEEILELADAREVDLLVLGSHGVGGLTEFRMASTAHKVAYASDVSVLMVPVRESVTAEPPFQSVLVPVDCTCHSDWAIALAAKLARAEGVDLVVLHVVRTPPLLDPQGTARERQVVEELVTMNRAAASRYLEGVKRRLESPEMPIRTRIEIADDIAPVLERSASAEERPLLVLSTRGRARFDDGPYGSLVAVMLANMGHPVLVLREPIRRPRTKTRTSRPGEWRRPREEVASPE